MRPIGLIIFLILTRPLEKNMAQLDIDNVSMRFDLPNGSHVQALQGISLNIKEGELLSVLGPSGCGKTTLLNILAGFLAPSEGAATLGAGFLREVGLFVRHSLLNDAQAAIEAVLAN